MTEHRTFEWDEPIPEEVETGGGQYRLLDPGIYTFTVVDVKRVRKNKNSDVIEAGTWGAEVTLQLDVPGEKPASVTKTIWLHSKTAWVLSALLKSCGCRGTGPLNASLLEKAKRTAASGKVEITHRASKDNKKYNEINKFVVPDKDEAPAPADTDDDDDVPPF